MIDFSTICFETLKITKTFDLQFSTVSMSGKDVPSRLLIVAPDTAVKGSHPQVKSELSVFQVFHPRHESCILLQQEGKFFEIQKSQLGKYASWFINQQVNSSKHIYLGSQVDPRFLLLPYFEAAGSRFSPLEQIVHSSTIATKGDGVRILPLTHWKQWRMEEVFDVNDKLGDDMILFRYNKDKTLAWLQGKVNKVALVLAKQRRLLEQRSQSLFAPSFRSGSAAPSHTTNTPTDIAVDRHDTKLAVEIVCDNLSDALVAELVAAVGFTVAEIMVTKAPTSSLKRKADWEVALEVRIFCASLEARFQS